MTGSGSAAKSAPSLSNTSAGVRPCNEKGGRQGSEDRPARRRRVYQSRRAFDAVPDALDNFVDDQNAEQFDADQDGYGSPCVADLNKDCIVNFADMALLRSQSIGEPLTADLTDDRVVDNADHAAFRRLFLQDPGPSGLASANCSQDRP